MKRHCTTYLPHYMVPDTITFVEQPARDIDGQGRLPAAQGDERGVRAMNEAAASAGLLLEVRLLRTAHAFAPDPWAGAVLHAALCGLGRAPAGSGRGGRARLIAGTPEQSRRSLTSMHRSRRSGRSWPPARLVPWLAIAHSKFARTRALDCFEVHGDDRLRHAARGRQGRDPGRKPHGGLHRRVCTGCSDTGLPVRALVQRPDTSLPHPVPAARPGAMPLSPVHLFLQRELRPELRSSS